MALENLLIDGERVPAAEGATFETVNPANGEVFRTVAQAGPEDADRAVHAAARAFEGWGARTPIQRAKILHRWADMIDEHADELALIETRDMGMAIGDEATQMGPLVSAAQRETVEGYVARGPEKGATLLGGGSRPDEDGFYLRPTILDECTNEMVVAREEIFGPVVSVIEFATEEEAIRLANDTPYGLSGSRWTRDGARKLRVARALRTGAIGVNSNSSVFPQAPFGGYKASGVGKELGMEGLVHNTELKSVFVSTEA